MKKLGALILGAILTIGVGVGISVSPKTDVAHAENSGTITINAADTTTGTAKWSDGSNILTVLQEKNTSNTDVKSYSPARWYVGHKITFTASAGYKINKMTFTCADGYANLSGATWSLGSVSGTTEAVWTNGEDGFMDSINAVINKQTRVSSIVFEYETKEIDNTKVRSVELDARVAVLTAGSTKKVNAIITPDTAVNKNVSWTSTDDSVATVKDGLITAVKNGVATITAKTEDGEYTDTVNLVVANEDGTKENPLSASTAIEVSKAAGETLTEDQYYITGTVQDISIDTSYGNATATISDGSKTFYLFRFFDEGNVKFTDASKIKVNDTITILAGVYNYNGKTPESSGGELVSVISSNVQSLEISGSIDNQYAGEPWNLSGITVTATYTDSTTTDVTDFATITANTEKPTAAGEQKVTVTAEYDNKTTSKEFTVNVLAQVQTISDVITYETLGHTATSGYQTTTFKVTSNTTYVANTCALANPDYVQLRANNNSGIITTTIGGAFLKEVNFTFNTKTTEGRTVTVYGSNTPYTTTGSKDGEQIGSESYQAGTTSYSIVPSESYKYISFTLSGAAYFDEIEFVWVALTAETVAQEIKTLAGGWNNNVGTANCATNYATAKEMILALSAEELNTFKTSTDTEIASARTTYENWCSFNGDNSPYEGAIVDASNIALTMNNNNVVTIVIILGAVLALAATLMLISKKRKLAK